MIPLTAIVPYFNFRHNPQLRINLFRVIRQLAREKVPYLIAELALKSDPFEIRLAHIQARTSSILWQKERLINLAFARCKTPFVAWIDGDVLLPPGWASRTVSLLENGGVCQLFDKMIHLDRNGQPTQLFEGAASFHSRNPDSLQGSPGGAWAAPTAIIQSIGIYDRAGCPSNDLLWFYAVIRNPKQPECLGECAFEHYESWKRRVSDQISHITYIEQTAHHLFHGACQHRNYQNRDQIPRKHQFDPMQDLRLNEFGAYEWNSEKPKFHRETAASLGIWLP